MNSKRIYFNKKSSKYLNTSKFLILPLNGVVGSLDNKIEDNHKSKVYKLRYGIWRSLQTLHSQGFFIIVIDDLKIHNSTKKHFIKEQKHLREKIYTFLIELGVHSIYQLEQESKYVFIDQILLDYDLKLELQTNWVFYVNPSLSIEH